MMESLYIDLCKGALNFAKLVKRPVQVKGENGKTFTRMQWCRASDDEPAFHNHPKPDKPVNIQPYQARLGLKHTDHGLSEEEVNRRHGLVGSLDVSELTKGTQLAKARKKDILASRNLLSQYPFTKDHFEDIDIEDHINSIFKNVTEEGIQHVFSDPKGKYTAKLMQLSVRGNKKHGHIECGLDIEWSDKKGNWLGSTSRSVYRDENGHLHVYNDVMELDSKSQNKGIAQNEQERTEQLWRFLSDGHPVHLSLEANISIGTYAWAMKGYDFEDEEHILTARKELSDFLEKNGMDVKETLNNCKYNSLDDLSHSWQFASLKDGNDYSLKALTDNEDVKKSAKGHIGKAFMLGGKSYWDGEKILNGSTEHESIASIHKKVAKRRVKKVG